MDQPITPAGNECPGHPADEFHPMGETQFCDGSCCNGPRTLDVRVSQLRVGDWLVGSGRLVTHAPSRGARTPSGKLDVGIDGFARTWGASTTMRISRGR